MIAFRGRRGRLTILSALAAGAVATAGVSAAGATSSRAGGRATAAPAHAVTPIKHVIVIIGENHTFDNVFATYRAPDGQHVQNLMSEGIVTAAGTPGRHAI
jgi:phospholipase C